MGFSGNLKTWATVIAAINTTGQKKSRWVSAKGLTERHEDHLQSLYNRLGAAVYGGEREPVRLQGKFVYLKDGDFKSFHLLHSVSTFIRQILDFCAMKRVTVFKEYSLVDAITRGVVFKLFVWCHPKGLASLS
jgi:hypothetical protein